VVTEELRSLNNTTLDLRCTGLINVISLRVKKMPFSTAPYDDFIVASPQSIAAQSLSSDAPMQRQPTEIQINDICLTTPICDDQNAANALSHSQWRDGLDLIEKHISYSRKRVSPGQTVYTSGQKLEFLYAISAGFFKIEHFSSEGHASNSEVLLDGDLLGCDAILTGHHTCTATALDFGEVWVVNYQTLLLESARSPDLLWHVVRAIGKSLGRCREQMLSNWSLSASRKVADFLVRWVLNLSEHGKRTDIFVVPLSRAEIGSFLGVRLETVSRALKHLADTGLISFDTKVRRQFVVLNLNELKKHAQGKCVATVLRSVAKTKH
jgi:CRP/FNR family transcriptional regulator